MADCQQEIGLTRYAVVHRRNSDFNNEECNSDSEYRVAEKDDTLQLEGPARILLTRTHLRFVFLSRFAVPRANRLALFAHRRISRG